MSVAGAERASVAHVSKRQRGKEVRRKGRVLVCSYFTQRPIINQRVCVLRRRRGAEGWWTGERGALH